MTDMLVELGQNKLARNIMARAKLPIPLPQRLERTVGGSVERPLEGKSVLVAGQGALGEVLARTLARAGAEALLQGEALRPAFVGPGEAYARPARIVRRRARARRARARDRDRRDARRYASRPQAALAHVQAVAACAQRERSGALARAAAGERAHAAQAAARAALDGFDRSLAKEIGGKGATANLIYVEEGAEQRARGACCASCSRARRRSSARSRCA